VLPINLDGRVEGMWTTTLPPEKKLIVFLSSNNPPGEVRRLVEDIVEINFRGKNLPGLTGGEKVMIAPFFGQLALPMFKEYGLLFAYVKDVSE
jgi:hypothetical protein